MLTPERQMVARELLSEIEAFMNTIIAGSIENPMIERW